MNLTTPENTLVQEVAINAPAERIFEALTSRERMKWWGAEDRFQVAHFESDLRPGGKWSHDGVGPTGQKFHMEGEYLEVDPPRLLVHTRIADFVGNFNTIVRWELEPHDVHGLHTGGSHRVGTGTLVRVRHSGFAGHFDQAQSHQTGWDASMHWLKAYVEAGETWEMRSEK